MLTSRTQRVARLTVLGALMAAAWSAPSASAAAVESRPAATIAFASTTVSGDADARTTIGTFAMGGPLADAGTLRTSYRFAGPRIQGTAVLIGDRGVFTVSLRGSSSGSLDGHEHDAGRWRVCGGTGAYRHLHGHGRWEAEADFGTLTGHLYRGAAPRG